MCESQGIKSVNSLSSATSIRKVPEISIRLRQKFQDVARKGDQYTPASSYLVHYANIVEFHTLLIGLFSHNIFNDFCLKFFLQ